jgi:hypothetical protein
MRYGSRATSNDETAPVIGDFDPPPGSPISSTTTLSFSVTDETGDFHALVVLCAFEDIGIYEVVHDGVEFGPQYRFSTREVIANGFRYTLIRREGWLETARIRVVGVDTGGNLVTLE